MTASPAPGDYLEVRVRWRDETPYGVALSGRLERCVRERLHPRTFALLSAQMERPPADRRRFPAAELAALVREERRRRTFRRITEDEAFWTPAAHLCRPGELIVSSDDGSERLVLPAEPEDCATLRETLIGTNSAHPALERSLDRLQGLLRRDQWSRPCVETDDPILVGHACVSLSDGTVRLWTDPFLRPKRRSYPQEARPLSPLDFPEQRHVILLTHAHPDHFDPGSLFFFPADTLVITPAIDQETLLTTDLPLRLKQLGLTNVVQLPWGGSLTVSGFIVSAHPFHGEQPLGPGGSPARPDRNLGNTYHVADPKGRTFLFLADAGGDPDASIEAWSRSIRAVTGRVDALFANHRTWRLYPPQYLTTSVPQHLLWAPDEELDRPQQIMMSPSDLRTVSEVLGARHVIPYAMGGAPWFAELGLGYDHAKSSGPTAFDTPASDPMQASDEDDLIFPTCHGVLLEAGQALAGDGTARWPLGTAFADPVLFARPQSAAPFQSLAVGGWRAELAADLLQITALEPTAFIVAAPNFVELIWDAGTENAMLLDAAERLSQSATWRRYAHLPLSFSVFAASATWSQLFRDLHRLAIAALRDGGDGAIPLRAAFAVAPFDAAPPPVIRAVARDLLDIEVRVQDRSAMPFGFGAEAIDLPASANPHIAAWGAGPTTLALLMVKATHNIHVTASACGLLQESEASWFARTLGA